MTTYLLLALTDDGQVTARERITTAPHRQYPTDNENHYYRLGLYDARFSINRRATTKWPTDRSLEQAYFNGLMDGARWEGRIDPRGPEIASSSSGDDRGLFSTYEVAGYSIDVVRLPDTSGVCDEPHPFLTGVSCRMPSDHVLRGQSHVGKGHAWAV